MKGCVRTIVVWKRVLVEADSLTIDSCVRTIVVWKLLDRIAVALTIFEVA